ncbi:F-box domain-containing protein [Colletotrichum truncatum]|uniref:F-box domain-containing protein n=1 Tax=Colletotrichum truncatum TaxID=5467 RepID=A0ACC3YH77_COLTU|nr:F-box domain-containing protein [Colletotrichum truncatum]KAF6792766.1 F-box domain-containing protein [Colletotrichum truncatum]
MSSMQTQSAMEVVLAIPELLESILIQLDMTTLLLSAMRVSKTWKSLMDESPAIQQALFLKPVSADVSQNEECHEGAKEKKQRVRPVINPLLAKKFNKCFFDFGQTYSLHRRANSFYELPWSRKPIQTAQEIWGGWSQLRPSDLDSEATRLEEECRRRFTRSGASWRRMFVSQPPPPSLGYVRFDISDMPVEGHKVWSASLQPASDSPFIGLRMGELYDIVQDHAGHHGRHSLWFRVLWGKPTSEFAISRVRETFEKLMLQTHVVVEFMHADDTSLPNHPQDPADVGRFDAAFRCEEYREVKLEPEETLAYPPEFPMFDGRFVIWHWRLLEHERATTMMSEGRS